MPTAVVNGPGHESRQRLLTAGLELFTRHGFHGTTTRAIGMAAGMSPAAVYIHFDSKATLLEELTLDGHTSVLSAVRAALDDAGGRPVDRLRAFVETFVRWHAVHAQLARVVQYEWEALAPPQRRSVRRLRRSLEELLRIELTAGIEAGAFEVDDVATTQLAVLSLGIDVARWYGTGGRPDADDLARRYSELAVRLVGARP